MRLRHRVRALSCPRGMMRVSLQHPDCSPSTGSRSGQAPPPVWPATTTEMARVSVPHAEQMPPIPFICAPVDYVRADVRSTR